MPKKTNKEEVLKRLAKWIQDNNRIPNSNDTLKHNALPTYKTFQRYFGCLDNAITEVSKIIELPENEGIRSIGKYTEKEILDLISEFIKEKGRFPNRRDFKENKNIPSLNTLIRRFGSTNEVRKRLGLPIQTTKIEKTISESPILRKYAEELEEGSKQTYLQYLSTLSDIREFLLSKGKDLDGLDEKELIVYVKLLKEQGSFSTGIKSRPNSIRTIKGKLRQITAFLTWILEIAEEEETTPYIKRSTVKKIKRKIRKSKTWIGVTQSSPRRALTPDEVKKIQTSLKELFLKYMFNIGLNLGLRISEYKRLTLDDLFLEEEVPYVKVKGKGGKMRFLALTDAVVKLIKKQLNLRTLDGVKHNHVFYSRVRRVVASKESITEYFKEMKEISGVKFTSHQVRYTHATMLYKKGVPRHIIKQRLGHESDGTDVYLRDKLEEEKRILEEKVSIL